MRKSVVAAAAAVLIAAAAAAAPDPATGVDWRYGRPGVFVVTNAEPTVTNFLTQRTVTVNGVTGSPVSNLVFNVSGGSVEGGVSAETATNIAQWATVQGTQGLVTAAAAALSATNAALWASAQATQSLSRVIAVENDGWWSLYLVTP